MRGKRAGLAVLGLLAAPISGWAGNVDAIYAFGDSLSDVGNIFAATGGAEPAAPYANGQFSNGAVWVQDLAGDLGLAPLKPSLAGGSDYAYGGAQTGTTPVPLSQCHRSYRRDGTAGQFQAVHATADPNALYTIWIGSNDLPSRSPTRKPTRRRLPRASGRAVVNIDSTISCPGERGREGLSLILTVTDLGKTPDAIAGGPGRAGRSVRTGGSLRFDSGAWFRSDPLAGSAGGGRWSEPDVLDTYSLLDNIVENPAAGGFTNVTSPCLVGAVNYAGGTPCAPTMAGQDQYLFWDDLHPTAAGHALIAADAFAAAVPEPGMLSLLGLGLAASDS